MTDNSLQSADKYRQESRAARCRGKTRCVSKFTAASRGPPCDSTASCLQITLVGVNEITRNTQKHIYVFA